VHRAAGAAPGRPCRAPSARRVGPVGPRRNCRTPSRRPALARGPRESSGNWMSPSSSWYPTRSNCPTGAGTSATASPGAVSPSPTVPRRTLSRSLRVPRTPSPCTAVGVGARCGRMRFPPTRCADCSASRPGRPCSPRLPRGTRGGKGAAGCPWHTATKGLSELGYRPISLQRFTLDRRAASRTGFPNLCLTLEACAYSVLDGKSAHKGRTPGPVSIGDRSGTCPRNITLGDLPKKSAPPGKVVIKAWELAPIPMTRVSRDGPGGPSPGARPDGAQTSSALSMRLRLCRASARLLRERSSAR